MAQAIRESLIPKNNLGIQVSMATLENPHIPLHWHDTVELLYCLNGSVTVHMDDKEINLTRSQLIAFDSGQVHSLHSSSSLYMFIVIQIDKKQLSSLMPDLDLYRIDCRPLPLDDKNYSHYLRLRRKMLSLVTYNDSDNKTDTLRLNGKILDIIADLIDHFATYSPGGLTTVQGKSNDTIRSIITYVSKHYQENIQLEDMAKMCGFSKEYFCRFFKQHMGMTFLRYLGEVRISQAGRLITTTDMSVAEVMVECGFSNQTIFNRLFKEIYKKTPREAKKANPRESYKGVMDND